LAIGRGEQSRSGESNSQLAVAGVAVEKLDIHKNGMILGDSKWSVAPYKSLIAHPDATLFWPSFRN
jgi:hypothetical protein